LETKLFAKILIIRSHKKQLMQGVEEQHIKAFVYYHHQPGIK